MYFLKLCFCITALCLHLVYNLYWWNACNQGVTGKESLLSIGPPWINKGKRKKERKDCRFLRCCGSGGRAVQWSDGQWVDHLTLAVYIFEVSFGKILDPKLLPMLWVLLNGYLFSFDDHQCLNGWMVYCSVKHFAWAEWQEKHYINADHLSFLSCKEYPLFLWLLVKTKPPGILSI